MKLEVGCSGSYGPRALTRLWRTRQADETMPQGRARTHTHTARRVRAMTAVGFESTPFRTGALSQRLRPLGQTVPGYFGKLVARPRWRGPAASGGAPWYFIPATPTTTPAGARAERGRPSLGQSADGWWWWGGCEGESAGV